MSIMETTQTYELADVGDRFIALIIDSIIIGIIAGIFGIGVSFVSGSALGILLWAGYQWYFLTEQDGQTPGKMVMKLRVVKADGTKIEAADALLRYFGYVIGSAVMGLGFLWAFIDNSNQGWHDKLAKTYVVKAERKEKKKNIII